MFCSNQILNICGDMDYQLRAAIECALKLINTDRMQSYKVENGYILFARLANENKDGFSGIPFVGDVDMLTTLTQKFLKSPEAKRDIQLEDFGDGSTYNGWELFIPEDYSIVGDFFAIRPFTTFYHK